MLVYVCFMHLSLLHWAPIPYHIQWNKSHVWNCFSTTVETFQDHATTRMWSVRCRLHNNQAVTGIKWRMYTTYSEGMLQIAVPVNTAYSRRFQPLVSLERFRRHLEYSRPMRCKFSAAILIKTDFIASPQHANCFLHFKIFFINFLEHIIM